MKKKFYGALLLGSLFLAGGMVSCSDYDDDINSLNERVDALEKTVADLKKAIEAGAVITNVQSTENGVTVTLSDGKTFEVKNGTNGAPGSLVTIDEEGYWCIDGVRQTDKDGKPYKAQGEKGDTGADGQPGDPGADGKDGCWYFPDEDGFWHKQYYNEEGKIVDEPTDVAWTPSAEESVRVVYDPVNGCLQISNAVDMEEGQVIYIPITSNLKSLAVIPYILDEDTKYPMAFFYNIMGYETKAEVGDATAKYVVASSTNAKVHYRLNPANANTQDWEWSMIDRTIATVSPAEATRAAGDKSELLSIKSTTRENDEFIVTLKSNKSLEDLRNDILEEHAIAALQGTNKKTAEVMTSDYVKVSSADLKNFTVITGHDDMKVFELPTVYDLYEDVNSIKGRTPDTRMLYTGSLDLNTIVRTEATDLRNDNISPITPTLVEDLVDEGELTYEYSLPKEFLLGNNQTNQQDFVTLDGSILKVNTEKWPNGTGAIGTTPIVEVYALVNGKVIASGVLKVAIVEKDAVDKPAYVVTVDPVKMEYSDINVDDVVAKFTWEDMRKVYDALSITREQFNENYKVKAIDQIPNAVELTNLADGGDTGDHTNAVEMRFNPYGIASNTEGVVKITYEAEDRTTYAPIVIEFPYTIYHNHKSFPDFNPLYVNVEDKVAPIRGTMVNGEWEMSTELGEHFLLNEYKADGNHTKLYAVLRRDAHIGAKLGSHNNINVDPKDLSKQVLEFTRPIEGEYVDIPVAVIAEKANGELDCVMTYTVRFMNHFEITKITIPAMKENANGAPVVASPITYTIKEAFGDRYLVKDGKVQTAVAEAYGLEEGEIVATYSEGLNSKGQNWEEEFGKNDKGGNKLTLETNAEGVTSITWDNAGSALATDVKAKLNLEVSIDGISIVSGNAEVVVEKIK
ncbi:MAG TPA: DUF4988 domain-containing protein [Phocaeicola coprocola]|uniref:DUF4988 domain-containing protein n=1 Tax=Phocaeicola coprocola TaxID=310298 RepID=A0A921FD93_9BACT|nr:DUF4988 domain-containing protein [Phocaeicola coprocola]